MATVVLTGLLLLLCASGASAQRFGSNLRATADTGLCTVPNGASNEVSCTYVQAGLIDGHAATRESEAIEGGVITSWRVLSGTAAPGTESVKMRLRLVDPIESVSLTGGSAYVELPLDQPGVHEFPARIKRPKRMMTGLDLQVRGFPGSASAPLGHAEQEVGLLFHWIPGLVEGPFSGPIPTDDDLELLFNATIERDRDHDGYGDRTQDRCPEDRKRQAHCDRIPPRTKLTYDPRQDFLHSKPVVVYVRTNEPGRVYAGGQIDIKGVVTWGIYSARKTVAKGKKVKLVLRVPANARESAARSFAHGRRVTASVTVYATDAAGNESGATVATIRPQR